MVNSGEIKGLISYLTKLTHTVDAFRFRFVNIEVNKKIKEQQSYPEIQYDLEITPKQSDIPYLWDFFSCKSIHIVQDGCELVGLDWSNVFTKVNDIYYNGERISRWGGYIPKWFNKKITKDIEQVGPKQINTQFFCGGERKLLTLNVSYEVSDTYIDDGMTTDISVYCHQLLVDGEPLETIVGYVTESDDIRIPLDEIIWDEITKYMDLQDCEIWTHTYTHIRNIGSIDVDDYNFVNQSTFSSKLCDFISGDN
jgi:hypothetical protein